MRGRPVALAAFLAAWPALFAGDVAGPGEGEVRHVVVRAEVWGEGRTPAEARREALERAREQAVQQVAGIRVSAQELRLRSEVAGQGDPVDAFASLVRTTTWGRIVAEAVTWETVVVAGVPVYRVELAADVVLERGEPDPGFTLSLAARPETQTFRDGESLALVLTASRDCFVHLLNVLPDGLVVPLFPRTGADPLRVEAGRPAALPAPGSGTVLRARLGESRTRRYEQVLAVATLDPLPLDFASTGADGTAEESWDALNRWLVAIPVDRRTEVFWGYEVVP